jgi:osomolarity two-component system sensor histidine kinase NIK1
VEEVQHVYGGLPGEGSLGVEEAEDKSCKSDDATPNDKQYNSVPNSRANMTISLDGLPPSVDHSKFYSRVYNATKARQYATGQNLFGYNSAPPTSNAYCPTCAKPISDPLMLYNAVDTDNSSLGSSPLVVPMGPLAAAAFESGMSAVEEHKLLKARYKMLPGFVTPSPEVIFLRRSQSPSRGSSWSS